MFSTLRTRFGIPGVISVIALVFAMLGGAYAANNSSGGKATASAKAKKGPRGPKGATGPAGPVGPAGAKGDKGDAGAAGSNGSDGASGTNGKDGETPTATKFNGAKGGCNEGGVEFKLTAGSTTACNGLKGAEGSQGIEGSPWTAGGTLPPGKTFTGAWGISIYPNIKTPAVPPTESEPEIPPVYEMTQGYESISFPLPLTFVPTGVVVGTNAEEKAKGVTEGCPGVVGGVPTADPGKLCAYIAAKQNITASDMAFQSVASSGKSGSVLTGVCSSVFCLTRGSWAVTAPPPAP